MSDHDTKKYCYGAGQIGEYLGCTESSVYQWVQKGLIPVGRLGGKLFASKDALDEHLNRLARGEFVAKPRSVSTGPGEPPRRGRGRPRKEA